MTSAAALKPAYARFLTQFVGTGGPELALFAPAAGVAYEAELMVVGRATNGWGDPFTREALTDPDVRESLIDEAFAFDNATCPMAWVEDDWHADPVHPERYLTGGSAFWRVTRRVAASVGVDGEGWASRVVWSNLYKAAPASGGNPSEWLCDAQYPGCVDILREEIALWRPKRLLVVTGYGWFKHFCEGTAFHGASCLPIQLTLTPGRVEAVGWLGETHVVVTDLPERRDENDYVAAVAEHFSAPGF